jgi:hypothetical protein
LVCPIKALSVGECLSNEQQRSQERDESPTSCRLEGEGEWQCEHRQTGVPQCVFARRAAEDSPNHADYGKRGMDADWHSDEEGVDTKVNYDD